MRTRVFIALLCSTSVASADVLEEIKVTAHPLSSDGLAQSVKVLGGEELSEKLQGSLGETIEGEVGIHSASFGVAVGRPVIHGLGGPRIKTTEDRIDSLDVSVTSTDHGVTVEPFIADKINILKGSSTLLYGSGAIGGVIDVETGRIPDAVPDSTTGRVEVRGTDNGDATVLAGRVDGGTGNVAWHIDAFDRQADDYDIPGFVESAAFRAAEEAEEAEEGHDEEHEEGEEERDVLEGSFSESRGGAIGFSFIGDSGFAGISVSKIDSEYGLVGGHGHEEEHDEEEHGEEEHEEGEEHEHEEEEEGVGMIDLEQTRIDLEGQWNNPEGLIEFVNFRAGINDYEHAEIEGNGEIGTLFDNDAWESRLLASHRGVAGFTGALGLQASGREFSAVGEEAFIPPVDSDTLGLFWVGEKPINDFNLEVGARVESVEHDSSSGVSRDFTTSSFSVGGVWSLNEAWTLSGLLDISSRAPSIEELFSNGPHLATNSFEIGDPDLQEEEAAALTFTADYRSDAFDLKLTAYAIEFDGFIYESGTGEIEDDLPVFVYLQNDASFIGLDAELAWHLGTVAGGDLDLLFQFDLVDAELDVGANRNLPRIPANRAKVQGAWKTDDWQLKLTFGQVSAQRDTADFELPTESYDDLSLYIAREVQLGEYPLTLFLHGRNLTDEEQRRHTSFVKEFAPAPGRRIEVGARFSF